MKIEKKNIITDIFIVLLIAALGTLLRFPGDGSAAARARDCALSDPDSYLYARRAEEYAENPDAARLFTRRSSDPLMSQPGSGSDAFVPNLLSITAAVISRLTGINVRAVIYCLCPLLGALAGVPAYIFVRRRTNVCGGITAGLSAALSASYLYNSRPGFFDTDGAIALLTVSLFTAFAECLLAENRRGQLVYGAAALAVFIIFAFTWEAYFAYLIIILICLAATAALTRGRRDISLRVPALTAGLMTLSFLLISGKNALTSLVRSLELVLGGPDWPGASRYTGELAAAPLVSGGFGGSFDVSAMGIVNRLGGFAAFAGAAVSAVLLACLARREAKGREAVLKGPAPAVCTGVFTVWLLISFPFAFMGIRFIQLPALPMGMLAGLGTGAVTLRLKAGDDGGETLRYACTFCGVLIFGSLASVNFTLGLVCGIAAVILALVFKRRIPALVSVLLAVSMLLSPVLGALRISRSNAPLVSPALDETCLWLRENSEEDAVIVSWWDYGYYIQYAAGRRTVADGGSDSGELYFWLADALMTDDYALSAAECVMLARGGTDASDMASALAGSARDGAGLLREILPLGREEARAALIGGHALAPAEADALLELTHPEEAPETYLIVYSGLSRISGALSYFALWDFSGEEPAAPDSIADCMFMKSFSGEVPVFYDKVFTSSDGSVIIFRVERPL